MKSATGMESDHGLLSVSSLVAMVVIGKKSDSGLLLASSSGTNDKSDSGLLASSRTKGVIGEGDSDSVLLLTYIIGGGEEYMFHIIVGCGLVLIFEKHRFILYDVNEYYQGSRSVHLGVTHSLLFDAFFNSGDHYPMVTTICGECKLLF